jgi:hypothetical protein
LSLIKQNNGHSSSQAFLTPLYKCFPFGEDSLKRQALNMATGSTIIFVVELIFGGSSKMKKLMLEK